MRLALLTIDDRHMADAALQSIESHARGFEPVVHVHVDDASHELGYCGAISEGWARLRAVAAEHPFDYVLHWECDFLARRVFDVAVMMAILEQDGDLAQIALKRGPHGDEPVGGFMAQWPESYVASVWLGQGAWRPVDYLRHENFWTSNPSVYPREIIDRFRWPDAPACEAGFARAVFAAGWTCAYLGGITDAPIVDHVGERTGRGY